MFDKTVAATDAYITTVITTVITVLITVICYNCGYSKQYKHLGGKIDVKHVTNKNTQCCNIFVVDVATHQRLICNLNMNKTVGSTVNSEPS